MKAPSTSRHVIDVKEIMTKCTYIEILSTHLTRSKRTVNKALPVFCAQLTLLVIISCHHAIYPPYLAYSLHLNCKKSSLFWKQLLLLYLSERLNLEYSHIPLQRYLPIDWVPITNPTRAV